ncbi:hypothetical protein BO94DRAFT_605670 [Aspergillus sclerotioniger CBS 115572]|uniref:Uncharacterized protein n=1 Tax=Aspergillus sclerotioniger CBS 115572 TaxID=1450535 RepID=A0A317VLN6_9EURO|nr:hypothetical protein BO94DRAFT_605670 [Aspergillus sclerotioniger CBS 115572]PWY75283.1 hypothetical protein BO94DRAFT_605670 [Aspergillus sclerotioniger CBS 115572]
MTSQTSRITYLYESAFNSTISDLPLHRPHAPWSAIHGFSPVAYPNPMTLDPLPALKSEDAYQFPTKGETGSLTCSSSGGSSFEPTVYPMGYFSEDEQRPVTARDPEPREDLILALIMITRHRIGQAVIVADNQTAQRALQYPGRQSGQYLREVIIAAPNKAMDEGLTVRF